LTLSRPLDGYAHGMGSFYHPAAQRRTRIIDGFGRFRLIIAANMARDACKPKVQSRFFA